MVGGSNKRDAGQGIALLLVLCGMGVGGCGGDDNEATPDTGVDVIDEGSEEPTPEPEPIREVAFRLTNGNPGGNSRWVQVRNVQGVPGWWGIRENNVAAAELQPHRVCDLDGCSGGLAACEVEAASVLELRPGESIEGAWDLSLYTVSVDNGPPCLEVAPEQTGAFRVQFCWSPVAPDANGVLPPATLSCTRVPFQIGSDLVVTYGIEALSTCGNGVCDVGETSLVCPDDCTGTVVGDVGVACNQFCPKLVACRDDLTLDVCQAGLCGPRIDAWTDASDTCLGAAVAEFNCAARLDCAGISAWESQQRGAACVIESSAVQSACPAVP